MIFRSIDDTFASLSLSFSRRRRRKSFSRKHSRLERALRTSRGSITDDGSTPKSSSPTHTRLQPFPRHSTCGATGREVAIRVALPFYISFRWKGEIEWVQEEKGTAESFEDSAALKSCLKEATLLLPPPEIFAVLFPRIRTEQKHAGKQRHLDCPFLETTSSRWKRKKVTADDGLHGSSIWIMFAWKKKEKNVLALFFFIAKIVLYFTESLFQSSLMLLKLIIVKIKIDKINIVDQMIL